MSPLSAPPPQPQGVTWEPERRLSSRQSLGHQGQGGRQEQRQPALRDLEGQWLRGIGSNAVPWQKPSVDASPRRAIRKEHLLWVGHVEKGNFSLSVLRAN